MVKLGVELVPQYSIRETVELVKELENIGIDQVWFTDHFFNRNPYVVACASGIATKRIELGIGVTNPYVIHPAYIASLALSLNELTEGRFNLGLGVGDKITLEIIGIKREKALIRLREAVLIIRELVQGKRVNFDGTVFRINNAKMFYTYAPVRVYIGAQASKTLQLAGELADGVLLNASHMDMLRFMIEKVKEGASRAARSIDSIDVVAHTCVSASDTVEKAKKIVKPYVAFIAAGLPDEYLDKFGIRDKVEIVRKAFQEGGIKKASETVTDDLIDLLAIVGTYRECIDRILDIISKLNINVTIGSPIASSMDEVKRFLNMVVQAVKST